nr:MAG TPA: hypothetical protein [Crassvirales sp.]
MKKYKILTEETKQHKGRTVYRIQALKDFADVKAGDKGGWIETEDNLSQAGNCWIYDKSIVHDNAQVRENAKVKGKSYIGGNSFITDSTLISGEVFVTGNLYMCDSSSIIGKVSIKGKASLYQYSSIRNGVIIWGLVYLWGNSSLEENLTIYSNVELDFNAKIKGNFIIKEPLILKKVTITSKEDYLVFKNTWSSNRYFTYIIPTKMWSVGCFYGTGKELIKKAYKDSKESGDKYKAYVELVEKLYPTKQSLWEKFINFFKNLFS